MAPVRSAFVVCEHSSGASKGVGYVAFALREDANSVYQQLNAVGAKGLDAGGRILRVTWADKKQNREKDGKDPKTSKKPKTSQVSYHGTKDAKQMNLARQGEEPRCVWIATNIA